MFIYESIAIIQTKINNASTLCINLLNTKLLVNTYNEKDSLLCIVKESESSRHATLNNRYIDEIIIATTDILLNLSGLSRSGGKNNKYNIPEKLNILLSPREKCFIQSVTKNREYSLWHKVFY